ncbi:MAG: hypothetical protein WBR18_15110 [Anaerolineales bacterium]
MNPPGRRRLSVWLVLVAAAGSLVACAPNSRSDSPIPPASQAPTSMGPSSTPSATPFQAAISTSSPPPVEPFAKPRQLTSGGCCAYPFWMADSSTVYFLGQGSDGQSRILAQGLSADSPEVAFERPAWFDRMGRFAAYPAGELTIVRRLGDNVEWRIPTGGRPLEFSPDGSQVAWIVSSNSIANRDRLRSAIWSGQFDGSERRHVVDVIGGSLLGWTADSAGLLVSGRLEAQGPAGVWHIELGKEPTLLFNAERVREASLSPEARWLAFYIAFSDDVSQDGLWLLDTVSGESVKLDSFGAFRWRGPDRLLVIPLDPQSDRVVFDEYQPGQADPIGEHSFPSMPIDDNDWSLSPDGRVIVYRSSLDGNLWWASLE